MSPPRSTRGHGLLERFLAGRRAARADRLIPASHRHGRILDVGCGAFPYFLARTRFAEKIGIDKVVPIDVIPGQAAADPAIRLMSFDLHGSRQLPLDSATVDVVTMLAVFEHLHPDRLVDVLDEVERVLRPGGIFIMTTPAGWTGPILTLFKWLGLVSAIEIDEHQDSYSPSRIAALLARTRFAAQPTRYGYFEFGLNVWVEVRKDSTGRRAE